MENAAVHALGDQTAVIHIVRVAKILRVSSQGHFMKIEVPGMFVEGICKVVDPWISHERAQQLAVVTAAFDLANVTVIEMNFPARIEAGVSFGSRYYSVNQHQR